MRELPSPQELAKGHLLLLKTVGVRQEANSDFTYQVSDGDFSDYQSAAIMIDVVDQCLGELDMNPRNRAIIHRLYGIPGTEEAWTQDVAKEFSLPIRVVKQIHFRTLDSLITPSIFSKLRPFYKINPIDLIC